MSRLAGGHSIIASKTTFDALAVESGEESEEEVLEVIPQLETPSPVDAKPTKSAIKKALKLARAEKRQRQKALARAQAGQVSSGNSVTSGDSPSITLVSLGDSTEFAKPIAEHDKSPLVVLPPPATTSPVNEPGRPDAKLNGTTETLAPLEPRPVAQEMPVSVPQPPVVAPLPPFVEADTKPVRSSQANHVTPPPQKQVEDSEKSKKRQSFLTRTLWTFIMIGGFIGLLLLGHAYMVLLVMLCQSLVYREVTALFSLKSTKPEAHDVDSHRGKDPWSKTLNWYFFAVTNYFLYGESIIYYFKHVVFADAQLLPFATNHRMISFILYTIGFMGFVMSLKKGYLKQQFGLFCWVHMSLLLIVVSSHFIVNNILEGLIWFWVPASLVICNDVFAYVWGITLGRTPLIKLSPKKTVEGFIGAFFSTILFGVLWGTYFMGFSYMICPVHDLGVSAWSSMQCTPNPVFIWREWQIWAPVSVFLSTLFGRTITTIPYAPYQFHLLFMSFFASLVAPFGGFFASGFKRAFNIKDFGHSIPGHGGMTDRMDCQFLMGVFTYVYYSSLIREHHVTVGSILQTIVSGLTVDEQLELVADLKRYLSGQGIMVP
ncbi:cytidylyltransferase family-domain-containing protein [Collybia nuda]|uniref:Phosphatidate cytidylyltransferase n=1 Tax=Collybia nuda TaxID=64659 RepID=A0A9P5YAE8_9AGAR|nr:cytidylyltransferase family-domain-containing protein [Collybia nuda]